MHPRSVDFDRLLIEVDCEVAGDDDRLRMSFRTAHDGVDPGDEFVLVERQSDSHRFKAKSFDLVLDARPSRRDRMGVLSW